ncbi:hypothetical protein CH643_27450, partial [Salmonella enterica subsp. enterica serovar Typhimurium]
MRTLSSNSQAPTTPAIIPTTRRQQHDQLRPSRHPQVASQHRRHHLYYPYACWLLPYFRSHPT